MIDTRKDIPLKISNVKVIAEDMSVIAHVAINRLSLHIRWKETTDQMTMDLTLEIL